MKRLAVLTLLLFLPLALPARTLEVSPGGAHANLESAAAAALPGDTILFRAGVYPGGQYVAGLRGDAAAWITIAAAPGENVVLRGGGNAWQLSDPAYLRIQGFTIEGQTGNGMNIDDGGDGSFDTPAHHILIEGCTWLGLDATGNNDELKMSGVDSFEVRGCTFRDGAAGGSMIDMVGCHHGRFIANSFERAGSNCIQAKGGTRYILIERNRFVNGGERTLNIGGSTGLQFFRPQNANYEASDIAVYSNTFVGSVAPIAFVGAVRCVVVNNTIYRPGKWAIRILQETTEAGFLQCGDNIFWNNLVVLGSAVANPTINVGPNTRPETFSFSHNLWFNADNAGWGGPNLPAAESGGIVGTDPGLKAPPADLSVGAGSIVAGRGAAVGEPANDMLGNPFATPRSIGAFEAAASTSVERPAMDASAARMLVASATGRARVTLAVPGADRAEIVVYGVDGRRRWGRSVDLPAGSAVVDIPVEELTSGFYLCVARSGRALLARPLVVSR